MPASEAATRIRPDRFWRVLLVIAVVALTVRVGYVALAKQGPCVAPRVGGGTIELDHECLVGDQLFYSVAAKRLAEGDGFVEPFDPQNLPAPGHAPAADHPPLTILVLAPVSWVAEVPPVSWLGDETHVNQQRYFLALLGAALVVLVGLLGRRVAGPAVGLVAAGAAAVYPFLWVNDGVIMSETPTNLVVVATLLAGVRFARAPCRRDALLIGIGCGAAALARAELLLFVPLLAIPVALTRASVAVRERIAHAALAVGAAAVVVAPWVAYNLSRFEERTLVSTNDGIALAGSNCDPVYSGGGIGLTFLAPPCLDDPPPPGDQSEVAAVYRDRAFDYMRAHERRVPLVVAARVARTWGVYRPGDMIDFNVGEGRERWVTRLGLVAYYPLLALAVAGAVLLARRRRLATLWVLAVPALVVSVGSAVTYGQVRFRAAAEPSIVVLASLGALALVARLRERGSAAGGDRVSARPGGHA